MKIKHFQGYGSVNAVKVSKKVIDEGYRKVTELVVKVSGMHEWGLEVNTAYDAFHWLVKYFDKTVNTKELYACSMTKNDYYTDDRPCQEVCIYTIRYWKCK